MLFGVVVWKLIPGSLGPIFSRRGIAGRLPGQPLLPPFSVRQTILEVRDGPGMLSPVVLELPVELGDAFLCAALGRGQFAGEETCRALN